MSLIIKKTLRLQGQVTLPSSKSHSIRALFLALLSEGESVLTNVLHSDDTCEAIRICEHLGAQISHSANTLTIKSRGMPIHTHAATLQSGNSGITTRFVLPILGLRHHYEQRIMLDCGEQMRARPVKALVTALTNLGLTIEYLKQPDRLPIVISGQLLGGKTWVDGMSSQYLSALLMALPCAPLASEIKVKNLHERPYVEMTLQWLQKQGIQFSHQHTHDTDTYIIQGGQKYMPFTATIAGDFSSASYLLAAAVLTESEIALTGLNMSDPQGDKRLVRLLQEMGADIVIEPNRLLICGGKTLSGIKIDANDIPDLLPTLAVIGTQALGKTEIRNVKQARIKETDRIHSMTAGLKRLGANIEEHTDGMTIHHSVLQGASLKGYDDHRTVMALSIAGMMAAGETVIDDSEAIKKTFPDFVTIMRAIGANMEVEHASTT